ncbi:hypothetical protein [Massilia sp. YIM B02443]|uniref:hypothetical protein n=1 Tax=Massilia sp. YIM B02443 TaxID=3050127 RepID=UPI0025B66B19|nr:hypothetical protein [Massilia sp. YIM B02443]MDN4038482.1 hypothetical protein [Massilia sp. YIM B02443]
MRDKKDNATFDLPGFEPAAPLVAAAEPNGVAGEQPKRNGPRPRRIALKQEQMQLLEETDTTGLPVWRRDDKLDLTGLPVWAPDPSDHP